ncbi:hypothetical protein J6590_054137 [Homalodisca vitripennis]|nr:hypothetical protein J6590_054137 [Homalodisca vitripennis]
MNRVATSTNNKDRSEQLNPKSNDTKDKDKNTEKSVTLTSLLESGSQRSYNLKRTAQSMGIMLLAITRLDTKKIRGNVNPNSDCGYCLSFLATSSEPFCCTVLIFVTTTLHRPEPGFTSTKPKGAETARVLHKRSFSPVKLCNQKKPVVWGHESAGESGTFPATAGARAAVLSRVSPASYFPSTSTVVTRTSGLRSSTQGFVCAHFGGKVDENVGKGARARGAKARLDGGRPCTGMFRMPLPYWLYASFPSLHWTPLL